MIQMISFSSTVVAPKLDPFDVYRLDVVRDADRIDALGSVGIARVFMYAGKKGESIEDAIGHHKKKLHDLINTMGTENGKKIALERSVFVNEFFRRLMLEL